MVKLDRGRLTITALDRSSDMPMVFSLQLDMGFRSGVSGIDRIKFQIERRSLNMVFQVGSRR